MDPLQVQEEAQQNPLSEAQVNQCDLANQKWQEHVAALQSVRAQNLTLALPLKSRSSKDVVRAISTMYCRFRSVGLPIIRVHCDRAQEFLSAEVQDYLSRDIWFTCTPGDQPAMNGRAESEVNIIKQQVRVVTQSSSAPANFWPLAVRHVAEVRFRHQLGSMGIPVRQVLPFGVQGWARKKKWDERLNAWKDPMTRVRVWGPSSL